MTNRYCSFWVFCLIAEAYHCRIIKMGNCNQLLFLTRRFLNGQNFMPWFQKRRAVAEQEQHKLWRQRRMNTDIQKLISTMTELETVDSFNAIEHYLLREVEVHSSLGCAF